MQRSNNYAANQVRFFLSELKTGNNTAKLKAVQRFQGYLERYQPEIYDDTVHFLFTGEDEIRGNNTFGLIYFCGIESDKHPGQLKRICGPLLSFVRWLLHQTDDIYLNNFVKLSQDELYKINFPKHILNQSESNKLAINIGNSGRASKAEDAFELLHILYQDHRNSEDEQDPIDINFLLQGDSVCYDRFHAWLQKSNLDTLEEELANRVRQPRQKIVARAKCWEEVSFKPIPLQEGEEVGTAEVDEGPSAPPPIPDPLKLRDVDLRETQEIYATGGLQKRMMAARRGTEFGNNNTNNNRGKSLGRESMNSATLTGDPLVVDEDEDDGDDDVLGFGAGVSTERRGIRSVIPSDKAFSIPLFLNLVHGGTTFPELAVGLQNLRAHLQEQSTRRVNLVRNHFGLFSQCAEGLEWLKEYRKGNLRIEELPGKERNYRKEREALRRASATNNNNNANKAQIVKGMDQLRRAFGTLDLAKVEAKNTLAPILERMKKMREVKSAEKVLKGMSTLLDYPRSMKTAYERGELKDVVQLYQRVQSIPDTSGLKITIKIKRAAEAVIFELKKTSLLQALSPSMHVNNILRHAQILLELEGGTSYLKILRLSFLRQASEFLKQMRDIREKMMLDAIDAYDLGQEVNLAVKSSSLLNNNNNNGNANASGRGKYYTGSVSVDSSADIQQQVYQIARRFVYVSSPETNSNANSNSSNSNNNSVIRPRASRAISTASALSSTTIGNRPRIASNASTNSGNGNTNSNINNNNSSSKKQRSGSFVTIEDEESSHNHHSHIKDETATVIGQSNNMNNNAANAILNDWTEGVHTVLTLDDLLAEYLEESDDDDNGDVNNNCYNNDDEIISYHNTYPENDNNVYFKQPFQNSHSDGENEYPSNINNNKNNINNSNGVQRILPMRRDYSMLFSHIVRRTYTERLVETIAKWFPCLFRLCCEILTFNNTDKSGGMGGLGNGGGGSGGLKGAFNTTFTKTMKSTLGLTSVSKLLGMLLYTATDNLEQCIHGLRHTFVTSFISPEMISAMNELDNDLLALQSSFNIDLLPNNNNNNSNNSGISTANMCMLEMTQATMSHCVRFVDICGTPPFSTPLRQQHEALLDVFQIHDALESAFQVALQKITATSQKHQQESQSLQLQQFYGSAFQYSNSNSNTNKTPVNNVNYRPFPANVPILGQKHATQLQNVLQEMDITSPLSPFFEAFRLLTSLAKESESSVAQKILDKIATRARDSSECLLFEMDAEKLFNFKLYSSPYGSVMVPEAVGVETTIHEFEAMVSRGITALNWTMKRPEWTAGQVYETLLQKSIVSLLEKLKRKMLVVEEMRVMTHLQSMTTFRSNNHSNNSNNRRPVLSNNLRRASLNQDNLVLSSLEEDLKLLDIGWERDFSSLKHMKNAAWIDFLRGLLRMRCFTLPRFLRKITSMFNVEDALSNLHNSNNATTYSTQLSNSISLSSPNNNINNSNVLKTPMTGTASGSDSLLNRLFAVESSPEVASIADTNHIDYTTNNYYINNNHNNGSLGGSLLRGLRRENSQIMSSTPSNTTATTNNSNNNCTNTNNIANNNNSNSQQQLSDRILQDWIFTTTSLLVQADTTSSTTQLMKFIRPYIVDCLALEMDVVEQYVAHRCDGLKSILFTAYAYLVQQELQNTANNTTNPTTNIPQQQLPGYLTRVLLALHEEKHALQEYLGSMSMFMAPNRTLFYAMKRSVQAQYLSQKQTNANINNSDGNNNANNGAVTVDTGGFSDSDSDFETNNNDLNSDYAANKVRSATNNDNTNNNLASQRYAHYLYQQLCHRVLDVFEELVKRLYLGGFGYLANASTTTTNNNNNNNNNNSNNLGNGIRTEPENPFKTTSSMRNMTNTNAISTTMNNNGNSNVILTNANVNVSATGTKIPLPALPVKCVLQAVQEYEFLKTVLRPLLLDTQVLQKKMPLSTAELQAIQAHLLRSGNYDNNTNNNSEVVVSSETLLQYGQMLMILIQQHQ